jgi:hypothetical protein
MGTYMPISQFGAAADAVSVTDALARAAGTAGYAPSIHNTQPWRWHLSGDTLGLYLERSRVLAVTDPDDRLATISCGAALNHARVALAATGWNATVTRLPEPGDPDHLAQLHVQRGPVDPLAVHRTHAILMRYTDRRPVTGPTVQADDIAAITKSVEAQGTWLHVLHPEQLYDLAAAAEYARRAEMSDAPWRDELAYWTGGIRPDGTGVPDTAIPAENPQTPIPGRDFGHYGTLRISAEHDRPAVFAMLYGPGDQPTDWLRAGEALSAGWLTATERGVTVLPLSVTIEVPATREVMRRLVAGLGYPYLILRLGMINPADAAPPPTPRLPTDQIIERL